MRNRGKRTTLDGGAQMQHAGSTSRGSQRFAFALGFAGDRGGGLRYRRFRWFRNVQIATAAIAELDVLSLQERIDCSNGQTHVTTGANLITNNRNAFFVARDQSVI